MASTERDTWKHYIATSGALPGVHIRSSRYTYGKKMERVHRDRLPETERKASLTTDRGIDGSRRVPVDRETGTHKSEDTRNKRIGDPKKEKEP
jgi:hypothetical protein